MDDLNHQNTATILSLHKRLLTLKSLPRIGWLQRGVSDVESVAEHTFGVSALAMLVGDQMANIDRGRLLAIALLHDMAEALIGDLPASARRFFGTEAKRAAEEGAMVAMLADLPQAEEYLALWQEYCYRSSPEARLIKQLDRLEMLTQALLYERSGSRAMAEFWDDADEGWSDEFPLVQSLAASLVAERNELAGIGYHV